MSYTVTYHDTEETPLADHDAIQRLETENVELEDVIDACTTYRCTADLYDAAGFRTGWVHADGTYRLQ